MIRPAINRKKVFVSPIVRCDRTCRACYVPRQLASSGQEIPCDELGAFFRRYLRLQSEVEVLHWGVVGEIGLYEGLGDLAADLSSEYGVFHVIETNGLHETLLDSLAFARIAEYRVSIDAPRWNHETNRGGGTWDPAIAFVRRALQQGHQVRVNQLVTLENEQSVDQGEAEIRGELAIEDQSRLRVVPVAAKSAAELDWLRETTVLGSRVLGDLQPSCRLRVLDDERDGILALTILPFGVYTCVHAVELIGDVSWDETSLDNAMQAAALEGCERCLRKRYCWDPDPRVYSTFPPKNLSRLPKP